MANTIQTEPATVHVAMANKNDSSGEVGSITHLEGANIESLEKLSEGYEFHEFLDSRQKTPFERKLVWKIDLLIVPTLALVYFVSFLDRNSLGNARVMGLQKTLHMSDQQYYNCAQMFFVGYTLCMLPGNILIRWIHPNWLFGVFIIIFGSLVAIMGVAQNYATVIALRILIGFAQAFIQGTGLYGSLWWKRDEIATRGSLYFSAATLSGAFSGLVAYAIQNNMSLAKTGKEPWRWLFIIEGVLGVVIGILVVCILPRFPDKIKNGKHWLFTPPEIEVAITRVANFNTRGSKLEWRQIFTALMDPKAWAFAFINGGLALGLSSIGVFLPTFIHEFGTLQLKPSFFPDRTNTKAPFLIGAMSTSAIGYILLLTVYPTKVKMFAACLICSGLYTSVVLLLTWIGINTGGFTKRGTVWAMAEIVGQCFSIMGSNVYKDKPRYIKGHSIVLAFLGFAIANATALSFWMRYQNMKRNRLLAEYAVRGEVHPHAGRTLEHEFDAHVNFRYII